MSSIPIKFVVAVLFCGAACPLLYGQGSVTVSIVAPEQKHGAPAINAVFWLEPLRADLGSAAWPAHQPYRLVQKNRMFSPHVLVVPVGASVAFPNEDPYFHNVFSLFEGSRFDLGLYEAGSTRDVRFSRKGISYIFCNIHPEMGAVVLSLDTPLWTQSHRAQQLTIGNVPAGTYEANLWVEGQDASRLAEWKHQVLVTSGEKDAGSYTAQPSRPSAHTDKFGHDYKKEPSSY